MEKVRQRDILGRLSRKLLCHSTSPIIRLISILTENLKIISELSGSCLICQSA